MGTKARRDYLRALHTRYQRATVEEKGRMLDEFCQICGYHRKYAIRVLNGPRPPAVPAARRRRGASYDAAVTQVLAVVWEAAGYPWSVRLKALLPAWLPWVGARVPLTPQLEAQVLAISPRQIDRRLRARKTAIGRRLFGRTKPGSLLKHQIPVKTDHWDVTEPGFTEIDLVSHSGAWASGEFAHTFTVTDIHSTWTEERALLGKGEVGVVAGLEAMRQALPFALRGIDSDNGSEFLNGHLLRYCRRQDIQFTRGRPYKKNDNAHVEQKNWTHVRRLVGWERYDSPAAVALLNDLYTHEWRLMMNLFQPSVKLATKVRVGSRVRRAYDTPRTPLDRLRDCPTADAAAVAALVQLRDRTDPFALAAAIDRKLARLATLTTRPGARPAPAPPPTTPRVTSQTARR